MVNFQDQGTVATPATDIVRIIILEARYNARLAIELFLKQKSQGIDPSTADMQSRIWAYWTELRSGMLRREKTRKDEINLIDESFQKSDLTAEELFNIFNHLNDILDELKLTQIDSRELYDMTRPEKENRVKNL